MSETYPEHEKLKALGGENQIVGYFIDWLGENGFVIAEYDEITSRLYPARLARDRLLAKHFEIDLDKLNDEKDAMLEAFRAASQGPTDNERAASTPPEGHNGE